VSRVQSTLHHSAALCMCGVRPCPAARALRSFSFTDSVQKSSQFSAAAAQGLAFVHFSAQLERCVWDRGCAQGLCSPS